MFTAKTLTLLFILTFVFGLQQAQPQRSADEYIKLLEGDLQLVACSGEHPEGECGLLEVCPVRRPLRRLHEKMMGLLNEMTLAELASDEPSLVDLKWETVANVATSDLS